MASTPYPHVNNLLNQLLARMRQILGEKLAGLYLYGSLVTGDYDDDTSDVDLLAAITADLDATEFEALDKMHLSIVSERPQWNNRLEIAYLSLHALKTFKTQTSQIAIISPGEPFHFREAGIDWLMNWYVVREKGHTLYGPPPQSIIEPASKAEYVQAVQDHMRGWRKWVKDMPTRPSQAYAILTMCRGLYTYKNGEQVSKLQAARWAEQQLPEWAPLIRNALVWRKAWRDQGIDHAATFPDTLRFVNTVTGLILGEDQANQPDSETSRET